MQKFFLSVVILFVSLTSLFVGCGGNPGDITPATKEELENDPALKEPGGV